MHGLGHPAFIKFSVKRNNYWIYIETLLARKVPSKAERYFSTGISMITSYGTKGPNVMAAEWVLQISYNPVLIAIFIHKGSQTLKNIEKTKEFGVNVASKEQTAQVSVAGGYSGFEIDKMSLQNIFNTLAPQKIKVPMISGCTINAECNLVRKEKLGDHVMLVGKVVHIKHDDTKSPLLYHSGRYFGLGPMVEPDRQEVLTDKSTLEFFKNLAQGRFVLKCAGVVVTSKNNVLVTKFPKTKLETIPFSMPPQGNNQRAHLKKSLRKMRLDIQIEKESTMKRLVLKNGKDIQRINFVIFKGKNNSTKNTSWKSKQDDVIANLA
ncbi:MAG TPA: flavin reductase family protein [Candidatus Nitrosotalea sp.]|nr:flavin reductase family protein [Candidatus Nitrosotalea sp.]